MKKRVLFHYPIFNIGGAEKSVMRMMNLLLESDWDVDLVLTTGGGVFEQSLDKRIRVYHLRPRAAGDKFLLAVGLFQKLKALPDLFTYVAFFLVGIIRSFPFLFRSYDVAVISLQGLSASFCCRWVKAKKRFQCIRSDLKMCDPLGKAAANIKAYSEKIDSYFCVAQTALDSLVELFPETKTKARVFYNVIGADNIQRQADYDDVFVDSSGLIQLVTVCRLNDKSKGLLRMVEAHKRLDQEGVDFRWVVVGDGHDYEKVLAKVEELGLAYKFILVGHKDNPYPWMKHADAVVVLSYFEGLCGVVNEAKVLGKAVLATEVSGVYEQIENNKSGLIVENDLESIIAGLKKIITDEAFCQRLSNNYLPKAIADDKYKAELFERLVFEV